MDNNEKLNQENLENISGGYGTDYVHDLNNYVYKMVCNLPAGTCLVMQSAPAGPAMPGTQYWNGDSIFVHKNFWENGYFLAYRGGIYGFVDSQYVR